VESLNEPTVRLIPLGGLGEIGLNMMLVESGDDVIAVDCGLMFPDDELPGIDYVIPDFSYALAKGAGFRGVVLTHGHEDHIGALPYLLKSVMVPVYATPLTQALVAEKLREHGLLEAADLRTMRPRTPFSLGPFTIEPIRVTHSIADGMGLAIGTPAGTIIHTGDFKLDPSPLDGEPASRCCARTRRTWIGPVTRARRSRSARRWRSASMPRADASSSRPSPRTFIASSRCSRWPPRAGARWRCSGVPWNGTSPSPPSSAI
jgi:mRNA degradation ribonuclease J1/J2